METFEEQQPWGKTVYEVEPGSHTHFQTQRQSVDLITNPYFGRMLFLDGVLQSTTKDEAKYHQALVELGSHSRTQHVLILGGAEGGMAREVLRIPGVESVVMVDWDKELVDHCREVEKWNAEAFADPRLTVVFENVTDFFDSCKRRFDTIYIDLLDITTSDDLDFFFKVYDNVTLLKNPYGKTKIAGNIGRSRRLLESCRPRGMRFEKIHIPSFQESHYLFCISSIS